jgi:hypothetical protein
MTCSNCQPEKIIPNVRVVDRGHNYTKLSLSVAVDADPNAMLFTGTVESALRAQECGDCGYTRLFADDHNELRRAHQESLSAQP